MNAQDGQMAFMMMNTLILKRKHLRKKIESFWKEGRTWTKKEFSVWNKLKAIHTKIIEHEMRDSSKIMARNAFSVCGWSEKHGYFREKRFTAKTLEEAKVEFMLAKKDTEWKIPTLIVRETYLRKCQPAMVDFDGDIGDMGFSDIQAVVEKSMCGTRNYRWKDLGLNDERFTY